MAISTWQGRRRVDLRPTSPCRMSFLASSRRVTPISLLLISLIPTLTRSMASSSSTPKNIVVVGGGIQGTSVAYQLFKRDPSLSITILESKAPASAASGKGGGFMARSWGDGSPTQKLHELAFDMYEELATELDIQSYRKLPVLSVSPGYDGIKQARRDRVLKNIMPEWLDGVAGRISPLGLGDDTAQITPNQVVEKMLSHSGIQVVLGTCVGVDTDQGSERGSRKITGVKYTPRGDASNSSSDDEPILLPADTMIVSAGPWSCAAEEWFQGAVELPMEGIKSTSIVWKKPDTMDTVDATALFCGEDNRFGTHLEVYPRPDGTIYICGIGGSDYISKEDLQAGAFREDCDAKESRVEAAQSSFQEMSKLYQSVGELDRVQACMRPCPPDAMPYMGRVPGYEGAYMNAGHNCWGIAWAPACGKAISELVLDGESKSVNLKPFDPARFTTTTGRGGRGRKRQGTDVGEQW